MNKYLRLIDATIEKNTTKSMDSDLIPRKSEEKEVETTNSIEDSGAKKANYAKKASTYPWSLRIRPDDVPPPAPSGPPIDATGTWDLLSDYEASPDIEADCLVLCAPEPLPDVLVDLCRIHVEELIRQTWAQMPLSDLKTHDVVLKIRSEKFGDFYLVSNPDARRLLPDPSVPHYTAAEAEQVLEMAKRDEDLNGIEVLHGLKKEFGGRIVRPPKKR